MEFLLSREDIPGGQKIRIILYIAQLNLPHTLSKGKNKRNISLDRIAGQCTGEAYGVRRPVAAVVVASSGATWSKTTKAATGRRTP